MNKKIIKTAGFTLIELVIVVAIIGIVASVAIPSYRDYIVRGQRAQAMDSLTEIMSQQQRFQTKNRTYATNLQNLGYATQTFLTPEEDYVVTATACGVSIARCVLLTGVPQGSQAGDYTITINSTGEKTFIDPNSGEVLDGWSHRTVPN